MKKRIYGLETEYGIALKRNGNWFCEDNDLRSYLGNIAPHFRENGSRVYLEGNFQPEYCTAECLSLLDLIAQDKAGERIIKKLLSHSIRENEKILLFKNNVDYADPLGSTPFPYTANYVTFGCHENFLIEKRVSPESLKRVFLAFLTARQVICGAGWVPSAGYQQRGIRYNISQRARFMRRETDGNTTSDRGIVCTARLNEPLSNHEEYQRFHLIVGDSNMSEFSTYLKMGTVGILLEMLEDGYPFKEIFMRDAITAIRLVSRDVTCKEAVIELEDGKFLSAINVLYHYLEQIEEYKNSQGLNPELLDIYEKFLDVVQRLEKRKIDKKTGFEENSHGLDEELDWLIKKSMLEETLIAFDCDWTNFKEDENDSGRKNINVFDDIRAKDLMYHETSEEGLYYHPSQPDSKIFELKSVGARSPRMVEEEKITKAETVPPQNTRAKLRGDFIKLIKEKSIESKFGIDWESISNPYQSISLSDPFETKNEILSTVASAIRRGDYFSN